MRTSVVCALAILLQEPAEEPVGKAERVFAFANSMPTGVTVSAKGRIFVNYPRWGDPVPFTVAELRDGREVPYPDPEVNRLDPDRPAETLVSVQSVVVDPLDRLWILDTASVKFTPVLPGGPKLVCVDLASDRIVKVIPIPKDVALPTTYLNDVRFDLRRGPGGTAFITDSSSEGPNGIIVVDLESGACRRRLHDHPSTKAERGFLPFVEGRPVLRQPTPRDAPKFLSIGSDGIAISSDGRRLYYCPLASRRLYSVGIDALLDESLREEQLAATVRDEGEKPAADGLESDAEGRLYSTAYEHNAIVRRGADGRWSALLKDPRILWPDTLAVAADGHLYVIANQLHRQGDYNGGVDRRVKPYGLFRIKIDGSPVRLRR